MSWGNEMRRTRTTSSLAGMAAAGLVLGAVAIVLGIIGVVIVNKPPTSSAAS